jgi:hypothetical protein
MVIKMLLNDVKRIIQKQREIQRQTRIQIMRSCTDDEIINNEYLKNAMGW